MRAAQIGYMEEGESASQLVVCGGEPSCRNLNRSSWDQTGERILKDPHQAFTYRRNVCSQRVREQITTGAASISAEY